MIFYLAKRIMSSVTIVIMVSFITFLILMWIPGDPAQLALGMEANPEQLQELRVAMGLTKPWYQQYFSWLSNFIKGDWGHSQVYGSPVMELLLQRLPVTFSLALFSTMLASLMAFGLGILSAIKKNSWIDYFSRTFMQIGMAIPSFWSAMMLVIVFGARLRWFPISGYTPIAQGILPWFKSIVLPSVALALAETGVLIRIIRSSMLTSLQQEYMEMAKAKALPLSARFFKYALRNALIAPVTVMGMQMAKLLGGTLIIESVFSMPGIGRLILIAVEQRDMVLLQSLVLFVTLVVIVINLMVDILYSIIDPRIKIAGEAAKA